MSSWDLLMALGFGLVALSSIFLVFIFWRARQDHGLRGDRRYRAASGALAVGKVGIAIWALNPVLVAFGYAPLPVPLRILASGLVLAAAIALIGSTALGGDRHTLKAFLLASIVWIGFCLWADATA